MKKNQKGFAITVMLYSVLALATLVLVLILTTMSATRKNNSNLIDHIKDDLNNASYGTETTFTYTGDVSEYTVGREGYYRIRLWGASGSRGSGGDITGVAGKGAYTEGIIYLYAGDQLYFYLGERGNGGCSNYLECSSLAFNGGGLGGYFTSPLTYRFASGGGASDVRLVRGNWNDDLSLRSRIMVAAGGASGDDLYSGGDGGTLIGVDGYTSTGGSIAGGGGSQISGGSSGTNPGGFGYGGDGMIPNSTNQNCNDAFGGGGGYYGGGGGQSGTTNQPTDATGTCAIRGYAGGGSSFMSGYAGVDAITDDTSSIVHSHNTLHYSGKYFLAGQMRSGENEGNGLASIQYVGTELQRKNSQLNDIRYIRDCISGNNIESTADWVEIQAIADGSNVAYQKSASLSSSSSSHHGASYLTDGDITDSNYTQILSGSNQCVIIDLGDTYDLDEVAVWHRYRDERSYNNHILTVSKDNINWITLVNQATSTHDSNGIRFNAYY